MPKNIWMAVHPGSGARTRLTTATSWKGAIELVLNAFGLDAFDKGLRIEFGPETLMNVGLCDFCCAAPYRWRYECSPFHLAFPGPGALGKQLISESMDDWMACDECKETYEGGGREALITRAAQHLEKNHPDMTVSELEQRIRPAYEQFELMRCGEPKLCEQEKPLDG